VILLWGLLEDPPLRALCDLLDSRHAPYTLLDQRSPPPDYRFRFGGSLEGRVEDVDLADVSAGYIRPFDYGMVPEHANTPDTAARVGALRRFAYHLTNWLELTPALIVNKLSAQASNTSKLYQLRLIRDCGFAVPASLVTTDARQAGAFLRQHGSVIYKSLSSVRSIVTRLEANGLERLESLQHCPTLFQQYVPGMDYRVHVVGRRAFATMLWSESDDYRYDELTERVAVELPRQVTERCIALTRTLGLAFSGIDLRRADTGEWFCFEANPSPGFPYYDSDGSAGIGEALVDLLVA